MVYGLSTMVLNKQPIHKNLKIIIRGYGLKLKTYS